MCSAGFASKGLALAAPKLVARVGQRSGVEILLASPVGPMIVCHRVVVGCFACDNEESFPSCVGVWDFDLSSQEPLVAVGTSCCGQRYISSLVDLTHVGELDFPVLTAILDNT